MKAYRGEELQKVIALAREAQRMVDEDALQNSDEGTCVLGAGIAVYGIRPRCRKPVMMTLTRQPFQGNVGSYRASQRALRWLQNQGVEAFWNDGAMD